MSDRIAKLTAKVELVNAVAEFANEFSTHYTKFFEKYVGNKILTKQGEILASIRDYTPILVPKFTKTIRIRHYRNTSTKWTLSYGITGNIDVANDCGYVAIYYETSVYIGNLDGAFLTSVCEPYNGRTDWNVEDILSKYSEYEIAKKAADQIYSGLGPFVNSGHLHYD